MSFVFPMTAMSFCLEQYHVSRIMDISIPQNGMISFNYDYCIYQIADTRESEPYNIHHSRNSIHISPSGLMCHRMFVRYHM